MTGAPHEVLKKYLRSLNRSDLSWRGSRPGTRRGREQALPRRRLGNLAAPVALNQNEYCSGAQLW